jgi:hypothetical protein
MDVVRPDMAKAARVTPPANSTGDPLANNRLSRCMFFPMPSSLSGPELLGAAENDIWWKVSKRPGDRTASRVNVRRLREQFLDRLGNGPTNLGVERVPDEADCPILEPDEVVLAMVPTVLSRGRLRT